MEAMSVVLAWLELLALLPLPDRPAEAVASQLPLLPSLNDLT